jgi:putative ATP-dependent endonuclease of OLD family
VNVGGIGLRRYARIFQRKNEEQDGILPIPVACVTDMDVMPDCAPLIIGKINNGEKLPDRNRRRWQCNQDFSKEELQQHRENIDRKASGQEVKTFIADEWTLEYDLALSPKDSRGSYQCALAKDVYIAAVLAKEDDAINERIKNIEELEKKS